MNSKRTIRTLVLTAFLAISAACASPLQAQSSVSVTLSSRAAEGIAALGLGVPVTGRVFIIVSRDAEEEPRLGTGVTGNPLWGVDVRGFKAGDAVVLAAGDESFSGYPLATFADLPPGEYHVQAFMNV